MKPESTSVKRFFQESLKNFALKLLGWVIHIRRAITRPTGVVLLAPDIPASNLGDQALLCGSVEGLHQQGALNVTVVLSGTERLPEAVEQKITDYGYVVNGSYPVFFATDKSFFEALSFYWLASRHEAILWVGADIVDGTYNSEEAARKIQLMGQCAQLGLNSRIFSFSLSTQISQSSKRAIQQLPEQVELMARDELSQKRAKLYRACDLVADCAFLMEPIGEQACPLLQKIKSWKGESDSTILGICIRSEDFVTPTARESFAKTLAQVAHETSCRLLFIPHSSSDIEAQSHIIDLLSEEHIDIYTLGKLPLAMEIKAVVSLCDQVLTSRMHVAIAALGSNTPISCIPYAGKFEGLLKHFELEGGIIHAKAFNNPKRASDWLIQRLNHSSQIAEKIKIKRTEVLQLAMRPFTLNKSVRIEA